MKDHIPFHQRLSCSVPEASAVTGIGRTKLYQAMKEGDLKFVQVGGRRLILVASVLELLGMGQARLEAHG
jgi:excisionase family DNA binding protein